jgi:hypothetical protein
MALTHEYGLMLICWSTWLVLFEVSLIYLMMYYWKHMVLLDIMVHAFFMWIGLHIGTYGWLVDKVIMLYIIVDL